MKDKNGITALMMASIKGHTEIAKMLIIADASVTIKDKDGFTALKWAASEEMAEILKKGE